MADPQFSVAVRNAILDIIEATIGPNPIMRIRTGAAPANTAAARTGTVLATINLPADWMLAAAGGSKSKSGTWEDISADAAGNAAHFEIMDSTAATCHMQGDISATGGGGFLQVDNVVFAAAQQFTVSVFTLIAPGS